MARSKPRSFNVISVRRQEDVNISFIDVTPTLAPYTFEHPSVSKIQWIPTSHLSQTSLPPPDLIQRRFWDRRNYEPAKVSDLLLLTLVVLFAFPFGFVVPQVFLKGVSLFQGRTVIAIVGGSINLLLAIPLIKIGRRIYSAAVWSTIIHSDIPLKDLDAFSDVDPIAASKLLWHRFLHRSKYGREVRSYDPTRWSAFVVYFIAVCVIAETGAFAYGRLVDFSLFSVIQMDKFFSIPVVGDLTPANLQENELLSSTANLITWTLNSAASINLPALRQLDLQNETIYFAEPTFATFSQGVQDTTPDRSSDTNVEVQDSLFNLNMPEGHGRPPTLIQHPAWGSRVACSKIPNITIESKRTAETGQLLTVPVPMSVIAPLYDRLDLNATNFEPLPTSKTSSSSLGEPDDGEFFLAGPNFDNGASLTFRSHDLSLGNDSRGFASLDFVFIRLHSNQTELPVADLPAVFTYQATETRAALMVRIDAAVCITSIESYVVESLNTTSGVEMRRVLFKGTDAINHGADNLMSAKDLFKFSGEVATTLDSNGKAIAYVNSRTSSRNQLLKDSLLDVLSSRFYTINPTILEMAETDSSQPTTRSYVRLDEGKLADTLGRTNVRFLIPNLVGDGRVAGRAFVAAERTTPIINIWGFAIYLASSWLVGLLGILFVPKLPLLLPSRDLSPSSWMLAFRADNVVNPDDWEAFGNGRLGPYQNLDEMKRGKMGEVRVRYGRS
ncbi:hypothetical protein BT69DRAFT_1350753 [Atractiella rhizophila]|nr:hypothetical protein BT69DRAFT_1350753 [Atractiella rhizophila]